MIFCNLFSDKCLGRLPGRFFIDFRCFVYAFFDDFFELFSGLSHKRKCHSDTLFTLFEAHCSYGQYAKNVIKSYTFQGCFSEWLREWILVPFSLILDSFWRAWGFQKWPNSHPKADQKNGCKKGDAEKAWSKAARRGRGSESRFEPANRLSQTVQTICRFDGSNRLEPPTTDSHRLGRFGDSLPKLLSKK